MQDPEPGRLYEACNVYKIVETNTYLALVEAFDSTSQSRRYFRSWTADSLDGPWTVLHDDAISPFAGERNVTFSANAWTADISHGEIIRAGCDEKLEISTCNMQYLYQGFDPAIDPSNYNKIPWKIALLTERSSLP